MTAGYIICTAPRSGSTLLCHMLRQVPGAGWPGSHLHTPALAGWLEAYGLNRADYPSDVDAIRDVLARARAKGQGDGARFALRLQGPSLAFAMQALAQIYPAALNDAARLEHLFGPLRYIHLTRRDKLGQAISRTMAEQTGLWHRHADGAELERLAPPAAPHYDRAAIAGHIAAFQRHDAAWTDWFAAHGITPLHLTYEALAAAPIDALQDVLTFLDMDPAQAALVQVPTAKLADAVNAEWAARFSAERAE